jgi:surface carbohydrate biosynthesis protein
VETKARELQAKLFLSCVAAEKGFRVILGDSREIRRNLASLPRGIFLDKSVAPSRAVLFSRYRRWGNHITAWCEEGLVINNAEQYLRRKVCVDALLQTEAFFTWGRFQSELIADRHPQAASRLHICGNPRIDLLRPELRGILTAETDAVRARFGSFVLVNTNFSLCNHHKGEAGFIAGLQKAGKMETPRDESFWRRWIDHKRIIFGAFQEAVAELSRALPDTRIVVRPHPSEDHDAWRRATESLANVVVAYEGNVAAWIMAAEAVVHNSCTTGLEAYLLDRPVVAFMPATSEELDHHLPNGVSHRAPDVRDLVLFLKEVLSGEEAGPEDENDRKRELVQRYIGSLEGPFAADTIVDELARVSARLRSQRAAFRDKIHTELSRRWCSLRGSARPIQPHQGRVAAYGEQKFPGLSTTEVRQAAAQFAAVSGRFASVRIDAAGKSRVRIRCEG